MSKSPAASSPPRRSPRRGGAGAPAAKRTAGKASPAAAPSRRRRAAKFGRERLYLFGLGMLLMMLGVMASGPYADYTAAQERVAGLHDQQTALEESVESLEAEAERLQDPAALEEQARSQLGLVRPGEIPYIVVNPPTEPPAPINANPDLDAAAGAAAPSLLDRLTEWVTGLAS